MSEGNWRVYPPLGVGLICVTLLLLAGLNHHQDNCESRKRATEQHTTNAQHCVLGFAFSAELQAPPRNARPKRDEWRQESDLKAQWATANWTLGTFITSVIGLLIASAGVYFVARTLQKQGEFFITERRAWLSLEVTVHPGWSFNETDIQFQVTMKATNVGLSPAIQVHYHADHFAKLIFTSTDLNELSKHVYEHKKRWVNVAGITVFSNQPEAMTSIVRFENHGLTAGACYITAYVSYRYAGSDEVHVTPVVRHVGYQFFVPTNEKRILWNIPHHIALAPD